MKGSSFWRQVSYPWKNSGSRQVKTQTYRSKSEWNCIYWSEQTSQSHNSFFFFFRSVAFLFNQKKTFINTKFIAKYLVIVPLNCSQEGDKRLLINRKLSPSNATEVYFFCFWIMITLHYLEDCCYKLSWKIAVRYQENSESFPQNKNPWCSWPVEVEYSVCEVYILLAPTN